MMKLISDLRAAASRENGAQSHGPLTPEGKQRSSQNAVKHGLSTRRILVDGESQEDLQALRVYWMRQLQPQTPAERELAEEVVACEWRVRRCQEAEVDLLNVEVRKGASTGEAFQNLADNSRALDLLHRYMNSAQRDFDRCLKRYHEVVKQRRAEEVRDSTLNVEGYEHKWGIHPARVFVSYYGRLEDVLPNEPELPGIMTAAMESVKATPKRKPAETAPPPVQRTAETA